MENGHDVLEVATQDELLAVRTVFNAFRKLTHETLGLAADIERHASVAEALEAAVEAGQAPVRLPHGQTLGTIIRYFQVSPQDLQPYIPPEEAPLASRQLLTPPR